MLNMSDNNRIAVIAVQVFLQSGSAALFYTNIVQVV